MELTNGSVSSEHLCKLLPHVDFRQTFGVRIRNRSRKNQSRNSLFMKIGEGVETRLKIMF